MPAHLGLARPRAALAAGLFARLALGCGGGAALTPATEGEALTRTDEGIRLTVRDAEPSDVEALAAPASPLWLTVHNGSRWPARLRYRGLRLLSRDGPVYSALPPSAHAEHALPEGPIAPGESVEGYVYFEPVPEDAGLLMLEARLATESETGARLSARVPVRRDD